VRSFFVLKLGHVVILEMEDVITPVEPFGYQFLMWTLLISLIVVCTLVATSVAIGAGSDKYNQITVPIFNPYYVAVLLLFCILLEEIIVFADEFLGIRNKYQAMTMILIGGFFLLLWAITFFHVGDIGASIWTSGFLAIFQFILFFYFFYQSVPASVMALIALGFSIYLFYEMITIASSNKVTI
jgi:hypothetical protein